MSRPDATPAGGSVEGALIHFELGGLALALEASAVREVGPLPCLIPVPLAPREVLGLAGLRDRAVTVLDLARVLGCEPGPHCERELVVLCEPWAHVALQVRAPVQMTLLGGPRALEPPVDAPGLRGLVRGFVSLEPELRLHLLAPQTLVAVVEERILESA